MKKEVIKVMIERNKDGFFWAYATNVEGLTGGGEDVNECKEDLLNGMDTLRDIHQFPFKNDEFELVYHYDTVSFFNYYRGIFTNAALERITGINAKQLQHYASGLRKPRPAQLKKLEEGLHKLGNELIALEL